MSDSRPRMISTSLRRRLDSDPDHLLVSAGDRSFTVAEFAQRVASVAAFLRRDDDDSPVVLLVDRSIDSAASLHGGFWSGRCVVPLGVDEPTSRLEAIIARLGPCTVVNGSKLDISEVGGQKVHDLKMVPATWIDPVSVPVRRLSSIIFTSGSTGRPKGITYQGWQSDAEWSMVQRDKGRWAVFGPLNWLGGLRSLNRGIVAGSARLIETLNRSPREILGEMSAHEMSHMSATPSLLTMISGSPADRVRVPTLREVLLNGESASWETVSSVRRIAEGPVNIRATYGASESILRIMNRIVSPSEDVRHGPLDLGEIEGDHVHLVRQDEFEDGYFGVVVRRWVAAGYVDDVDLQTSRFGRSDDGDPEWRSGDVVRIDVNGLLWHTGRSDDLVKIAGKLVSPSEATAVLSKIHGVRQAVVLTKALESGKTHLIGHVEAGEDIDPDAVRRRLVDELPAHLIPAVLVRHDQLPMAGGGKVDRHRLLSEPLVQWRRDDPVEPRNDLERFVLIEAVRMLGLPDLGVDDDLWTFGLDSLGAIDLSETLSRTMSSNLTVNDFIGASTIATIAQRVSENRPSKVSNVVTLVEADDEPSVFIMTGAGSPALRYRELAHGVGNGTGVVGLEQWGLLQRTRPNRSVVAAAKRNVQHVIDVAGNGRLVLIGHSWGGLVAHEMAVRLEELGRDVVLVLLDSGRPRGRAIDRHLPSVLQARDQNWLQQRRTAVRWRVYWILRPRLSWLMRDDRFERFFWRGIRTARRHRVGVFSGPMLVVQAETSTVGEDWLDQPGIRIETTRGSHLSMCHAPHVQGLVDIVNTFVTSCREDVSTDRG